MKTKFLLTLFTISTLCFFQKANAQGGVLPLNGSVNGNLTSSTPDVYSITTTADGLLRLTFHTVSPADLYVTLYDNNETTALGSLESYNSSTVVLSTDGLAAGNYVVKITPFSSDYGSYTLADSLFTSPIANDQEPNGSKAIAKVLPLNGSKTGHVGFYYNNQRDTSDWYKVTTNADGLLRLTFTNAHSNIYGTNLLDVIVTLYDNDGITQLGSLEPYGGASPATGSLLTDGLAAGTYYIKVQPYSNTEFADYTFADSLFTSSIANDAEPNGSKALAKVLPLNSSKTGHVGFYYNNQRDTSDWYKVTTNADGLLRLTFTNAHSNIYGTNLLDVIVTLYDNDGITQLGSFEPYNGTNPVTGSLLTDRFAAGTYYVKVQPYSITEFADYILADSLFTYNANDNEPDDFAYQASTIPANGTATGHISFYYNGGVKTDYSDWFKVNYTGSGNLQFAFDLLPHLLGGGIGDVYFQVYKDTSASPIFNQEYYGGGATHNVINLTSLTQGYYYIHIIPYNSNPSYFTAYSITPTFTQVNKAKIQITSYDTAGSCTNNTISYKLTKSHSPYSVQLFRFGTPYANGTAKNSTITFDSLPDGVYYATVYGDGATGTAKGKSDTITLMPAPAAPKTTAIQSTQAKLNWTLVSCADYDTILFRVHGAKNWRGKVTKGNVASYILRGLVPSTSYDWQVAAIDSENNISAISAYTDSVTFTTTDTGLIANANNNENNLSAKGNANNFLLVSPNPARSYFIIHYNSNAQQKANATLYDVNGKAVWVSGSINANTLNGKQVMVGQFAKGIFYLKIIDENGQLVTTAKVIISE